MASMKARLRGTKVKIDERPDPEDALRTLELEGSFLPGFTRGSAHGTRAGLSSGSGAFIVSYYDAGGELLERRSFKSALAAERAAIVYSEDHAGEGLYAVASPHSAVSAAVKRASIRATGRATKRGR
jgi:hypothetical protein